MKAEYLIDNWEWVLRDFGSNLRGRRELVGLTQSELADMAGFDRTYISRLESGKANISLKNLYRLGQPLSINGAYLLPLV